MSNKIAQWSVVIIGSNGDNFDFIGTSEDCRSFFALYVSDVVNRHSYISSITLYDNCHRIYKQYIQNY